MRIGIDVGYGYVKTIVGDRHNVYPSLLTDRKTLDGLNCDFGNYTFEDVFVGDATINSKSRFLRSAFEGDRLDSEVFHKLFLCGIAAHGPGSYKVVTGLPVNGFKLHRNVVKGFIGDYSVVINGSLVEFSIDDLVVVPQPFGTYVLMVNTYPQFLDESVMILDIGFKTTDILLVDRGNPLADSSTINMGIADILKRVTEYVNQRTESNLSINQGDKIIREGYFYRGERYKVPKDELKIDVFVDTLISRLRELYPDFESYERLILTGGGAVFLGDSLNLSHAIIAPKTQFANVLGYSLL